MQSKVQDVAENDESNQIQEGLTPSGERIGPNTISQSSPHEMTNEPTESSSTNVPKNNPSSTTPTINPSPSRGAMYLILTNISKRTNVRSLLMTAASFGCCVVFVAGQRKFDFDPNGPDVPNALRSHIMKGYMRIERFDKLNECVFHIRSLSLESSTEESGTELKKGGDDTNVITEETKDGNKIKRSPIRIVGVEIDDRSVDVESAPFVGDTAFMMGNEGQGLSEKQKSLCDGFVKISQYGNGTASLNVNVAASIVLHRFHLWSRGIEVGQTL
mmetsp:Transcript_1488/g.2203  ORF Transcript_1488/g.2203 Transcript_1488/m.2203 type:complete len:273 (-) Transcript_1488:490-1308(-)